MAKAIAQFTSFADLADWGKRQEYRKKLSARKPHKGPPPPKPPQGKARPLHKI